ncbi:hypothetical protein KUCAC02_029438 [Chaenocephalus aceratus]|nr:hypothetical protein KUCAC02_029438 [Chaenocephalus aceratus]
MRLLPIAQKKSPLMEVQLNGGSTSDPVDWAVRSWSRTCPFTTSSPRTRSMASPRVTDTRASPAAGTQRSFFSGPLKKDASPRKRLLEVLSRLCCFDCRHHS